MDIDSEQLGMKLMVMNNIHLGISESEYQVIVRMSFLQDLLEP
jgi:hypothetical protein